jgi:hypothetical protein
MDSSVCVWSFVLFLVSAIPLSFGDSSQQTANPYDSAFPADHCEFFVSTVDAGENGFRLAWNIQLKTGKQLREDAVVQGMGLRVRPDNGTNRDWVTIPALFNSQSRVWTIRFVPADLRSVNSATNEFDMAFFMKTDNGTFWLETQGNVNFKVSKQELLDSTLFRRLNMNHCLPMPVSPVSELQQF